MKKTNENLEKMTKVKMEKKQMKKEKSNKKHKWLKRFIAIEYVFAINVILITNCSYQINYAIENYQETINDLKQTSVSFKNLQYDEARSKVTIKQTNYMANDEKNAISESEVI